MVIMTKTAFGAVLILPVFLDLFGQVQSSALLTPNHLCRRLHHVFSHPGHRLFAYPKGYEAKHRLSHNR